MLTIEFFPKQQAEDFPYLDTNKTTRKIEKKETFFSGETLKWIWPSGNTQVNRKQLKDNNTR